jgi:hypothetical protein
MATASEAGGSLAAVLDEAGGLEESLARVRSLVEADRVEEARALAPWVLERWPHDERAQYWVRVLEPPVVSRADGAPNQDFPVEREWLKQHRHEYPGCWIAVREDQLIAAYPELERVYAEVRQTLGDESAVVFFQPPDRP